MFNPLSKIHVCAITISIILLTGCAPPRYTPSFRVEMNALDLSPLQGRSIVIDPGHGGRYAGAVGVRGLRESDINLAVGLHLWGLLEQAGARVWMTRSADIDLCPYENPSLREDLESRCQFSNNLNADLFISIHHNSNTNDRKKNNTQIYYKLSDPGPSQDLARCVANEMSKGQYLDEIFVFPGNFFVLRNTRTVAILGEASFISNKKNETRLSLSNQLRREAEDYFLGILTCFQKGIPEVIDHYPDGVTIATAFPQIEATISGGESIDPETLKLYLNGEVVPSQYNPKTGKVSYTPESPLKNGEHTFSVEARNHNGNAVRAKPAHFYISLPPAQIKVHSSFSSLPADEVSSSRIEVVAFDRHGNPVIDGTPISLEASAGSLNTKIISTITGRGSAYFFSPEKPKKVKIDAQYEGITGNTIIQCGPVDAALVRIRITDNHNKPIDRVRIKMGETLIGTSDKEGLAFIKFDKSGEFPITLERSGYLSKKGILFFEKGAFREKRFSLIPREEGMLLGRKFTLDPEPWDEHTEKKFGLRADSEEANLLVAKKLQTLLEEAGAITTLTRNSLQQHPTLRERVLEGESFAGEYFITLTHRKSGTYVAHYFQSQTGKQLAQQVAQALKQELNLKKMKVQERADFTIIHPSAPAIVVNPGRKHLCKRIKKEPETLEREAWSIYQGLVTFLKVVRNKSDAS
ncbi:MAG: N-acetylmuramoyl-L-alanine amidase [Proteobacteria bacterium]|nr:N-acetylmuramoyl-L-alanine amidase [Pseudomonadota bacterium]